MSNPSPRPKWSQRMNSAMRRTSTLLTISRPTTPSVHSGNDSSSDSGSVRKLEDAASIRKQHVDTSPVPPAATITPSPIAESPAREAAAIALAQEEARRQGTISSPLKGESVVVDSPEPMGPSSTSQQQEAKDLVSPVGFTPPPLLDSTAGNPGAFTDEPEELPQPVVAVDPYGPRMSREMSMASASAGRDVGEERVVVVPKVVEEQKVEEDRKVKREDGESAPRALTPEPVFVRSRTPEPAPAPRALTPESVFVRSRTPEPAPAPAPAPRALTPEPAFVRSRTPSPAPAPRAITPEPAPQPPKETNRAQTKDTQASWVPSTPDYEPPAGSGVVSYFDKPVAESIKTVDTWEAPPHSPDFAKAVEENSLVSREEEREEREGEGREREGRERVAVMPTPAAPVPVPVPVQPQVQVQKGMPEPQVPRPQPQVQPQPQAQMPQPQPQILPPPQIPQLPPQPQYLAQPQPPQQQQQGAPRDEVPAVYTVPTFVNYEGHDIWGGAVHKPIQSSDDRERERVPQPQLGRDVLPNPFPTSGTSKASTHVEEDPFADPVPPPGVNVDEGAVHIMPHPAQPPSESHEEAMGAIIMPLPPIHEVIPGLHHQASNQSLLESRQVDTDENRPLLSKPFHRNTTNSTSYLQPSPYTTANLNVSATSSSGNAPRLHDLGWIEYQLPDGTYYYVHPTRRVVADLDLRHDQALNIVTSFLDERTAHIPQGAEMWLRDVNAGNRKKRGVGIVRSWVDHHSRAVVVERDSAGKGKRKEEEDDALDMQYRYWSFMETHPAHTALPVKAKAEAMDILTWAWTDGLLPPHHAAQSPFTRDECQELSNLLRSYSAIDNQNDLGIQTRIVSRILLRVARWRQRHLRPNKPLPKDVSVHESRASSALRRPLRRIALDVLISCLCLGIPYIFMERSHLHRIDAESGIRAPAPMLVIGACTCLVAAIVLSASVTFLSLPGLDSVARVAGLVAILFASFSMASTLVAIFRYKADMARTVSFVGSEGMLIVPRRPIVMSLPLVFLAYAVIGFITGIVTYSFRGVILSDPTMIGDSFDDYTRWTVVGILGALAGILTMSLLLSRRW